MKFISTRGSIAISAAEAIINGLAPDGGLYVPQDYPKLSTDELQAWSQFDYPNLAANVMLKYIPEAGFDTLLDIAQKSASKFDCEEVTPLVKADDNTYVLELWHGPTHAFKDVALTTLPHLLSWAKKTTKNEFDTLILVATSGDTGKAALEGFADIDGFKTCVFYPSKGVSELQKLQMTTQKSANSYVFGIDGNFDDAQSAVKSIFSDEQIKAEFAKNHIQLSSANSINLGRLLPQVTYYFSAYFDLVNAGEIKMGTKINFSVPTGNFGDILAGYYAKMMGLPIMLLLCASNMNNVLTDMFETGEYSLKRDFHTTMSPSMDILISSNFERFLFDCCGRDVNTLNKYMLELKDNSEYSVDKKCLDEMRQHIVAECASEDDCIDEMKSLFDDSDYLVDPHTAVAAFAADAYLFETGDPTLTVVLSTASPYKFVSDVLAAVGEKVSGDLNSNLEHLEQLSGLEMPASVRELTTLPIKHKTIINKSDIKKAVLSII